MAANTLARSEGLLPTLPYLLSGVLPLWAGMLLAAVSGFPFRLGISIAGTLAVAALILAAFTSQQAFYPGAGRCPRWTGLTPQKALLLSYGCLTVAALLGLLLQFWWQTGDFTLLLGGLGAMGGYFSFAPPLQWHRRGFGEVAGALCFGLLPVATGLYLQCGHLLTEALLYGMPFSMAAYNLFLINGFPKAEGETGAARHSLAERLGAIPGALIYTLCNILVIMGLLFCLFYPAFPLPLREALWPLILLAVVNQELIKRKAYRKEAYLKLLCRLTLGLHLGLGVVFNLMLWRRL